MAASRLRLHLRIRTRLLLLVLAVWLPAVVAIALLARATYLRETSAAEERVALLGQRLNRLVEREIDKRAQMAKTLAATNAVRDRDFARFHEEASIATRGGPSWAVLFDRSHMRVNTALPRYEPMQVARVSLGPFTTSEVGVFFVPEGGVVKKPLVSVSVPETQVTPPQYNVSLNLAPSEIQALVERHAATDAAGGVISVIDDGQRVIARSREPKRWLGQSATGDVKRRATAGEEGFAESVTLDGVPSLTYLAKPNAYGWTVVIGMPKAVFESAARRVTVQAFLASILLLLAGLGVALYGSRRIHAAMEGLRESAAMLGNEGVPPPLATGVAEVDDVSAVLHRSGLKSRDATRTLEERVAEAVLRARDAQAQSLEAQKHETIGRLTGGIAHDFNNLLQTIGTAHHVLKRHVTDGPQRRVLDGAVRATAKAADLIRQMLTFGRTQTLTPQVVDIEDMVLKSSELMSKAIGERITLTAALAPELPPVFVDPVQFELAMLNVVFNARDAISGTGHIVISARAATPEETDPLPRRAYVCFEVTDDGQGMDAQTLARVFEPYYTTKAVGAGSGLGLPQAQAFARQSGGDIRMASLVGQGTRVSLFLPVAEHGEVPQALAAEQSVGARPSLRVLMVEDDVLVSSVVVPALTAESHEVTLCSSADEAMRLLADTRQRFDVLFTDVVMPGQLTGLDLVAWCRTHRPELPSVVATGYSPQQLDLQPHVLRKPYEVADLLVALHRAAASPAAPGDAEDAGR